MVKNIFICLTVVFFGIFIESRALAIESVQVFTVPENPVKNVEFELKFLVETKSEEKPYVTFDPEKIEILEKNIGIVSTVDRLNSMRIATSKKYLVTYKAVSSRSGDLVIRNIVAEDNHGNKKIDNYRFKVLEELPVPKDIFLDVDISRSSIYAGEGVNVKYYVYSKVNTLSIEVSKYPKLNNFIKRFYKDGLDKGESVVYQNIPYKRIVVYSARLYPEKTGTLRIDPIFVKVNQSLGGMQRERELASPSSKVDVIDIPASNLPADFDGLVGSNDYKVLLKGELFPVNTPIEIVLEVTGDGALEKLQPPKLYSSPALEEFDVQTEITYIDDVRAKKTFKYTYLPRDEVSISQRALTFSSFDSLQKAFRHVALNVPALNVSKGIVDSVQNEKDSFGQNVLENNSNNNVGSSFKKRIKIPTLEVVAPNFVGSFKTKYLYDFVNCILMVIFILMLLNNYKDYLFRTPTARVKELKQSFVQYKANKINYSALQKFLYLGLQDINNSSYSVKDLVNDSQLSRQAKKYFIDLLKSIESLNFNKDRNLNEIKVEQKFFNEVIQMVIKNENNFKN